jgi:hypothetical protein
MTLTNETITLRSSNIDKAIAMYGATEEMDGMGYTLQDMRDLLDTLADREERIAELTRQVGIEQVGAVKLLERIERVKGLAEKWRPDEENALMEYDGDNHGDTAEAAYNRCLKMVADELLAALDGEPKKGGVDG